MAFKLITFDFTNTLMRFSVPPALQYAKVAAIYGINIEKKIEFQSNFKAAFRTMNDQHPNFGSSTHLPWAQWWLQVVKRTFINAGVNDSPKLDLVAWHLIKLYSTMQGWEIIPGADALLHKLAERGQRMGVISNFDPRLNEILKEAGLYHHFEFVLSSYEAKTFKPHPTIFQIALERYSKEATLPNECCHIGDTYKEDFIGATQAGWNAILVNELSPTADSILWCKTIQELDERCIL